MTGAMHCMQHPCNPHFRRGCTHPIQQHSFQEGFCTTPIQAPYQMRLHAKPMQPPLQMGLWRIPLKPPFHL